MAIELVDENEFIEIDGAKFWHAPRNVATAFAVGNSESGLSVLTETLTGWEGITRKGVEVVFNKEAIKELPFDIGSRLINEIVKKFGAQVEKESELEENLGDTSSSE